MNSSAPAFDPARFAFGDNWRSFLRNVDEPAILEAEHSLKCLLGIGNLQGQRILDIGSGSGLFSLAARRLGAQVCSFDYDPGSVECTRTLKDLYFPNDPDWTVEHGSILDAEYVHHLGAFDIVYSWGVLHHTGDLRRAIAHAASCVAHGGLIAFALYRKTPMCALWHVEKRWYASASPSAQERARRTYVFLMKLYFRFCGRDFQAMVKNYRTRRGMDFACDVHDWMGGYPYESISPDDVAEVMSELPFALVKQNVHPSSIGLFGTGCDEFVYRRNLQNCNGLG